MDIIKPVLLLITTPQCLDEYFVNFNFFDGGCFKTTLSKCLGLGIILGSLLVKVPQIVKILQNKSGAGINVISVTLDLTAITIYTSYSYVKQFPFTSWGDSAFLGLQTAIIAILVLYFAGNVIIAIVYFLLYLVICFILMGGTVPVELLWTLQGLNIPILLVGKLSQAVTNYKNGNTGQLSAITVFMLFFGSLARIFTSVQETGDFMTIVTYIASTFANAIILFQQIYYWNVDVSKTKTD